MRRVSIAIACLSLLGLGCRFPWEAEFGSVLGVVRYPDKTPVYMAKVSIVDGNSTFTDVLGRYRLELRATGDTVTVVASDGYAPGVAYAETHWGSARVVVRRSDVVQDIVLDHATPI